MISLSRSHQVVSSAIVDKYIGESARLIREMFGYARDHEPCIIFMDEIDAIGMGFYTWFMEIILIMELVVFVYKASNINNECVLSVYCKSIYPMLEPEICEY